MEYVVYFLMQFWKLQYRHSCILGKFNVFIFFFCTHFLPSLLHKDYTLNDMKKYRNWRKKTWSRFFFLVFCSLIYFNEIFKRCFTTHFILIVFSLRYQSITFKWSIMEYGRLFLIVIQRSSIKALMYFR